MNIIVNQNFSFKKIVSAIALAIATSAVNAAPSTAITELGNIGGWQNAYTGPWAAAINNHGQVVGNTYNGSSNRAFIWKNGVISALPTMPNNIPFATTWAYDINDAGQIAGSSSVIDNGEAAVIWQNGTPTIATGNSLHTSYVHALNNNGYAITEVLLGDNSVIWKGNSSVGYLSNLSGDYYSRGNAINDQNIIVGKSGHYDSNTQNYLSTAVVWNNGVIKPLENLSTYEEAFDINEANQIVGYTQTFAGNKAVIWQNGKIQTLGDIGNGMDASMARAINENGQVVGNSSHLSIAALQAGFLWVDGQGMRDLNELVDPASNMKILTANDINDKGQIVGQALNADGKLAAYMLTIKDSIWTGTESGNWDDGKNWDWGMRPSELQDVSMDSVKSITITGPEKNVSVKQISLGTENKSGYTTLKLNGGEITPESYHLMIGQKGILTGDGKINGDIHSYGKIVADNIYGYNVINHVGGVVTGSGAIHANFGNDGDVRLANGQQLLIDGENHSNTGKIEVINAEMEVNGEMANYPNTGLITGRNATLRFNDGLVNAANISFTGGANDVSGDIKNIGGKIITTGVGTSTTFYDDVKNDGEIRTAATASSIFLGTVSGNGSFTGGGKVFFEGDLRPGHSPGYMSVNGDVIFGDENTLTMEIGGYGRGTEYDAFDVIGGSLALGGKLEITMWDNFAPVAGDVFTLIMADMFTGEFDAIIMPKISGLQFNLLRDATSIKLSIANASAVPVPATAWLMGSGLIGLAGVARRRRQY